MSTDEARLAAAVEVLGDPDEHAQIPRLPYSQAHRCEVVVAGRPCNISQEEHHRLALGIIAENRDLRRRLEAFEHGTTEETP